MREIRAAPGAPCCQQIASIHPGGFTIGYNGRNTPKHPMESPTRFGFVAFAETWNGRLAMLGFVIGLGTELLTGQGILSQIGLG